MIRSAAPGATTIMAGAALLMTTARTKAGTTAGAKTRAEAGVISAVLLPLRLLLGSQDREAFLQQSAVIQDGCELGLTDLVVEGLEVRFLGIGILQGLVEGLHGFFVGLVLGLEGGLALFGDGLEAGLLGIGQIETGEGAAVIAPRAAPGATFSTTFTTGLSRLASLVRTLGHQGNHGQKGAHGQGFEDGVKGEVHGFLLVGHHPVVSMDRGNPGMVSKGFPECMGLGSKCRNRGSNGSRDGLSAGYTLAMRAVDVLKTTYRRVRRPMTWGAILVFGLLWNLVPWSLGMGWPPFREWIFPFLWGFAVLAISTIPWQWTGDDRPLAKMGRGFVQALPWNGIWALGLLLVVGWSHPRPQHDPNFQARRQGWRHNQAADMPRHEGLESEFRPESRPESRSEFRPRFHLPIPPRLLILAAANLCFGLLLGWILAEKERAEAGESAAVRAAEEARAHALQSRMNPHVLFNAISGLAELVREEPEAAERALVNLSGLLRNLLDYGTRLSAPLSMERTLVEQYLSLEQIRLGRRLLVEWQWDEALESREVPPLLIQPLVENALKHGIAPNRAGGELRIILRRCVGNDGVEIEVANTGLPLADERQEGIGLRNLQDRLALFLPGASFRIFREENWTRAVLFLGAQA